MPANERRLWWCPKGHIIGEINKVTVGGHRLRALMLYEHSVEPANVPLSLPALRGKVIGSMDDICCTLSGRTRDWIIGEDGIKELLQNRLNDTYSPR